MASQTHKPRVVIARIGVEIGTCGRDTDKEVLGADKSEEMRIKRKRVNMKLFDDHLPVVHARREGRLGIDALV
jgi:hypothetical protein